jgi:hypothetical protein
MEALQFSEPERRGFVQIELAKLAASLFYSFINHPHSTICIYISGRRFSQAAIF